MGDTSQKTIVKLDLKNCNYSAISISDLFFI